MKRLAAIVTILLFGLPHGVRAQDIIATVNGESVKTSTFEERYKEYLARTGTRDAARLRNAVLAQLVNDRLIIADGRRRGVDDGTAFRLFEAAARRKLLLESYLAQEVRSAVTVTGADVEDAFVRINTEIDARHLFARTRDEADQLHERLLKGESFEDLAREVFADPALAENGGSIGRFTFDELDPDFEDAAFGLGVGEISQPVRTAQGYSIIQVLDRFTKPILTELEFATRKEKLRAFVLGKKQVQARSHYLRARVDRLNPSFHPGFERLFGQVTGVVLVDEETMEDFLREPLVSFDHAGSRTTWTVADFRDEAAFTPAEQRAQVRTELDLRDFVNALVVRRTIVDAAERSGLDRQPEFEQAMRDATDAWVLEKQKERLLANVHVPADSIRAHYERYPSEFTGHDGVALPVEEAHARIENQLQMEYTRRATLEFIASLRRSADIEIDTAAVRGISMPARAPSPAGATSLRTSDDGLGGLH